MRGAPFKTDTPPSVRIRAFKTATPPYPNSVSGLPGQDTPPPSRSPFGGAEFPKFFSVLKDTPPESISGGLGPLYRIPWLLAGYSRILPRAFLGSHRYAEAALSRTPPAPPRSPFWEAPGRNNAVQRLPSNKARQQEGPLAEDVPQRKTYFFFRKLLDMTFTRYRLSNRSFAMQP